MSAQHGFHITRPGQSAGMPVDPNFDQYDSDWSEDRDLYGRRDVWALYLPHQCDEWVIGSGSRDEVLAAARRFRAELDEAITALEASDGH